jgi:DNA repair protein RadA/Sms
LQVADRAERLALDDAGKVDVLCENSMDSILQILHERKPKLAIIDSVQTVSLADVVGSNGSVSQVPRPTSPSPRLLWQRPSTETSKQRLLQFLLVVV